MSKKINRRDFIKASGAAALSAAGIAHAGNADAKTGGASSPGIGGRLLKPADLPAAKGPRLVVVGGGWSGLTLAKYVKLNHPEFDVVLIDKKAMFVSCPMSNVWLADQIDLEFISHSFLDAAKNNNYLFLNAAVIDLDRESKKVFTEHGYIEYEYLVMAPGM